MIRPGDLRDRVVIQQSSESRNAMGESVLTWHTFGERWAQVEGISAREFLLSGQQQAEVSHRVRLRWVSGLTTQMRFLWGGRVLEIVSLLEHANRTEHEAICQESL